MSDGKIVPIAQRPLVPIDSPFRWDGDQETAGSKNDSIRESEKSKQNEIAEEHNVLIGRNGYRGDSQEGGPCQVGILHGSCGSKGREGGRELEGPKKAEAHHTECSYTLDLDGNKPKSGVETGEPHSLD